MYSTTTLLCTNLPQMLKKNQKVFLEIFSARSIRCRLIKKSPLIFFKTLEANHANNVNCTFFVFQSTTHYVFKSGHFNNYKNCIFFFLNSLEIFTTFDDFSWFCCLIGTHHPKRSSNTAKYFEKKKKNILDSNYCYLNGHFRKQKCSQWHYGFYIYVFCLVIAFHCIFRD